MLFASIIVKYDVSHINIRINIFYIHSMITVVSPIFAFIEQEYRLNKFIPLHVI